MKPYRVCLFLILCLIGSAVAVKGWRFLPDMASLTDKPSDTILLASIDTLPYEQTVSWHDTIQVSTNPYHLLSPFYEALTHADEQTVRVVHYGDSQIEGDRMTFMLRRVLQERFGGCGTGTVAIEPYSDLRTAVLSVRHGGQTIHPKTYRAFGPASLRRPGGDYGPMAQVSVMDNSLSEGSENITVHVQSRTQGTEGRFTRIRVISKQDSIIQMEDTATSYTLHLSGKQDIYGISLESPTGVQVDNVALRGSAGTIFTQMAQEALWRYYDATRTRLIIWQFGGNAAPYIKNQNQVDIYMTKVRQQIRILHRLAPYASIMMVGPSDMLLYEKGERHSYAILPAIDTALKEVAAEEQATYWSLFEAMGGTGSMAIWQDNGWAGRDGIHFTRDGADKAGKMLTDFLLQPLQNAIE